MGVGAPPTPEEMEEAFGFKVDVAALIPPDVALGALLTLNDPEARAVGVPGGGGILRAPDLALLYQGFLHNPDGPVGDQVLVEGTQHARMMLPDMWGVPASRTLGLVVAGDDGLAHRRGLGRTVSPRRSATTAPAASSPSPTRRPGSAWATSPPGSTST